MKIDRLLAIIVVLIHKKRVKAAELSSLFEVSERTIYRDIDAINRAGIPILSLPGQEGGYQLMDGFQLDKKYLALDELISVQWALQSIERATGFADITQLIAKIDRLIEPEAAQAKNVQLHFSQPSHQLQHIQAVYQAIQQNKVSRICYVNHKGEETERHIEPMGIYLKGYSWYVWGFCLLREGLRVFKFTRIVKTTNTERHFTRRPFTIEDVDATRGSREGKRPFKAYLQFNREMKAEILDQFRADEIVNNPDGTVHVSRHYYSYDQAIAQIISFRNKVRIVSPQELIEAYMVALEEIKSIYADR